jgi:uncharacterized protein YjbI with pentapeptide repeats
MGVASTPRTDQNALAYLSGEARKIHRGDYSRARKAVKGSFAKHVFEGAASFEGATFKDEISFADATFDRSASFEGARFERRVSFSGATFEEAASFAGATFCDGVFLGGSLFAAEADFREAVFEGRAFGRRHFTVVGDLDLTSARFARRVNLVASADVLSCGGAILEAGGVWELCWAEIDLRRLVAQDLLVIRYDDRSPGDEEALEELCRGGPRARERGHRPEELGRRAAREPQPRLLSVSAANVGNVVLSGIDLRACRFRGAYNLDRLRIYEDCRFARTPGWTGRSSIAEEHHWRATRRPSRWSKRWYGEEHKRPRHFDDEVPPTPQRVAALYRALRKGLEDHKDEPGAADFYYGEMEMRRHSSAAGGRGRKLASWWERVTVWLYWMLSGYALRPFRAFLALVALIVLGAGAFQQYGFADLNLPLDRTAQGEAKQPPPERLPDDLDELGDALTDGDALVYSVSSAAALAPLPAARLTPTGRTIRTVVRILGPILLALLLLSIRGRVKR